MMVSLASFRRCHHRLGARRCDEWGSLIEFLLLLRSRISLSRLASSFSSTTMHFNVVFTRDELVQGYSQQEGDFLVKRKGGGGGGGKSSGGGAKSSGSSSSSSSSGSKSGTSSSSSGTGSSRGFTPGTASGGSRVFGSSTGRGISTPYGITSGAFVGRQAGGGTRSNIYSGGGYGSGYTSGYNNRGLRGGPVGGLGFPFICECLYHAACNL
jgi:hypothetical protein